MQYARDPALTKQIRKNRQLEAVVSAFETKIAPLSRQQLSGGGFQLEPIKSQPGLWSVRINQGTRLVCQIEGEILHLLEFQGEHDRAYGQGGRKGSLVRITANLLTLKF